MADTAPSMPRRVGRPARLDKRMIAQAAAEIGLDRITMKAVADRLGVSVPGLYHHIEGRSELMRLAAEYSASKIQLPDDHGQHWTAWLLEWAKYSYDAFVAEPELLGQFLHGSVGADRIVENVDLIIGLLERQGFTGEEAMLTYSLVGSCAIGAAVHTIREREATQDGRPLLAEYHRALAQRPPEDLPYLRKLVGRSDFRPDITRDICTVLLGIAIRRGEPVDEILKLSGEPGGSPKRSAGRRRSRST